MDTITLARELMESWTSGTPLAAPPSSSETGFDMDAAYATEAELTRLRREAGHIVTGRKVGYANKAMWRVLKLETLVWAAMYDDTVHSGAKELSLANFITPRIEPEIVFKLKQAMPEAGLDAAGALGCVEWLAPGFEIIDCPWPDWQFKPADFVAAFGLHRALVVGEALPVDSASIPKLAEELGAFKVRLLRNGELIEEGSGKNSLRSPPLCLAELAAAILHRSGATPLRPGELISTGTLTGARSIQRGEVWRAEVEGLAVNPLEVRFL
ncbi:MAG TPA: fumarylacetoacetate hydrolase family protein [Bryobacteraceae bacterium]|nr:fumarylacetoacetate hydrolase family protein [Bryobacteraceae bacterium]